MALTSDHCTLPLRDRVTGRRLVDQAVCIYWQQYIRHICVFQVRQGRTLPNARVRKTRNRTSTILASSPYIERNRCRPRISSSRLPIGQFWAVRTHQYLALDLVTGGTLNWGLSLRVAALGKSVSRSESDKNCAKNRIDRTHIYGICACRVGHTSGRLWSEESLPTVHSLAR